MNSRTLNFAVETSGFTCRLHRLIREAERAYMLRHAAPGPAGRSLNRRRLARGRRRTDKARSVYDFTSDDPESSSMGVSTGISLYAVMCEKGMCVCDEVCVYIVCAVCGVCVVRFW